jgi:hypothetical protein
MFIYIFIFPLCWFLAPFLRLFYLHRGGNTILAHDYKFDKNVFFPEFYGSSAGNIGIIMWITLSLLEKDTEIEIRSSLAQVS